MNSSITKKDVLRHLFLWSWRGLNPRPNEEITCFLHAYLCLHFRPVTRPEPPITSLSPNF